MHELETEHLHDNQNFRIIRILELSEYYVSEVGSGFEYNRAGFAYNHVPKAILVFQVQLDEL
jgi:hypothetical protein